MLAREVLNGDLEWLILGMNHPNQDIARKAWDKFNPKNVPLHKLLPNERIFYCVNHAGDHGNGFFATEEFLLGYYRFESRRGWIALFPKSEIVERDEIELHVEQLLDRLYVHPHLMVTSDGKRLYALSPELKVFVFNAPGETMFGNNPEWLRGYVDMMFSRLEERNRLDPNVRINDSENLKISPEQLKKGD